MTRSIWTFTNISLMMFTGNKSSGTIFGSHEWHFEKLEILPAPSERNYLYLAQRPKISSDTFDLFFVKFIKPWAALL